MRPLFVYLRVAYLVILAMPLASGLIMKDGSELIVFSHHDNPSIWINGTEMTYLGFEFRPTIIEKAAAAQKLGGAAGDGGVVNEEVPAPLIKEELKKEVSVVEQTKSSLIRIFGRSTLIIFFAISLIFLTLVGMKEVIIDGRSLNYEEKLVYYISRPYRIIYDSGQIIEAKKRKKQLKEEF